MAERRRVQPVLLLASVLAAVVVVTVPGVAHAHPWGTPPEAVVTGEGNQVTVEWSAEEDDALVLGVELGLLDPVTLDWSQEGPRRQAGDPEAALLPSAEPLDDYLLANITVWQNGSPCAAHVEPFEDFVSGGATTVHECPGPVEVVELEISMLHDIHEAYRTFGRSQEPAHPDQAVFTATTPRHSWMFGDAAARTESGGSWLLPGTGALVALLVGAAAAIRRRRRRGTARAGGRREDQPRQELAGTRSSALVPLGLLAVVDEARFGWLEAEFIKLIDLERVGVLLGLSALLIAFGIGAAHALAPGHGKALIGAYLVGTRGRPRDAVALGSIVAVMHCASVLVFGGVLFTTVRLQADVGQLIPWLSVAAGVLVMAVGGGLVVRQFRTRAARRAAAVERVAASRGAADGHAHPHDHHHGHSHELPEGVRPLSRKGVVTLGVSGGLLPSPSAFLVLATAILMGRALFGLALVAAFSLGLAATLTAFGLAAVRGRRFMEQRALRSPRLLRLTAIVPVVSSVIVLIGGFWITTTALLRLS